MLEKEKLSIRVNNNKDLEKKTLTLFKNNKNNLNKIKKLKKIGDIILKKLIESCLKIKEYYVLQALTIVKKKCLLIYTSNIKKRYLI